jgi:nucleotide-binding universal stress UspA family protein
MALKFNLKKILVPTDFSEHSLGALHYAAAMAKHSDAEIVLLHVMESYAENVALNHAINLTDTIKKAVNEKLMQIKTENMDLWGIKISMRLENGKIYKVITDVLEEEKIDLVVMGTHGSSGINTLEKYILGSNAYRIIRVAECPVITVRESKEEAKFKTIVLPLDTTKETKDKVASVVKIAKVFGATVHVISVSTRWDEWRIGGDKMKAQLEEVSEEIKKAGVLVVSKVIRKEDITESVLDYAKSVNADLLVIMTSAESKLAEFTVGSSARTVISESSIPVLSIRPGYK